MQTKKMSLSRKILLGLCSFIGLFLVFLACLPSFVSTETGKETLLSFFNKKLPGTVQVSDLSLNWMGPQSIEGLKYEATDGKIGFSCKEMKSDASLFSILFSSNIGQVQIEKPDAIIHQTLIETPLRQQPQIQAASLLADIPLNSMIPLFTIPFIGNLTIEEGKIAIFSENASPIIFHPLKGTIMAHQELSKASIHIEGQTLQNGVQGTIFIDSSLKETDSSERSLETNVSLKHFPIDGADQILALRFPEYRGLLTEAIGPSLDLECHLISSKELCKASLKASSQGLQVESQAELKEDTLVLSAPAYCKLSLSPAFFKKIEAQFPLLKNIVPTSPIELSAFLKSLTIPKTDKGIVLEEASFLANIEIRPFELNGFSISSLGSLSSQSLSEETLGNLDIYLQNGKETSTSKLQFSLQNLLKPSTEYTASLDLGKTPTSFLNPLFDASFSDVLGGFIEGSLSLQGNEKKTQITLQANSPFLQTETGTFVFQNKKLSLFKSWQIHFLMEPHHLTQVISPEKISLQKKTPVTAVISKFELSDFSNLKDLKADAFISSSPLVFPTFFNFSQYHIENLSLHLIADSLDHLSLSVASSRLALQFKGGFEKESRTLFWQKPVQVQYVIDQKDFHQLYQRKERLILLEKAPLQIQIEPGSFSFNTPSFDTLKLTGSMKGEKIWVENATHKEQFQIQDLKASFDLQGVKDSLDFSLSSNVLSSFGNGKLSSQGSLKQLSSPNFFLKAQLDLQKFPVEMIDPFLSSGISLAPLLGSPFDLSVNIDKKNEVQTLRINGKTPLLKISGGLTLNAEGLFLTDSKDPLHIELLLTPKGYDFIAQKTGSPFVLSENTLFKASVVKLNVPFLDSETPDLSKLLLKANVENDQITFYHKGNKKNLRLANTRLSLQKKDEMTPLSIVLDTLTEDVQKGALHVDAQLQKILNEKGEFQFSQMHSSLVASFQKFPSDVLELIFPSQKGHFSDLLGRSFDMTIKASLQNASGPIALSLSSPTTQLSLEGTLKSGTLTLKQNAFAKIALTPQTSKVFLQEGVNPLSISSLYSTTPLSIELDARGFSLPLFPFVASQVEIPNGRISLGKVFCRNEGNLNLMLGILKAKQAAQSNELELWFTPIDFHVKSGVVNIERTEILIADTYDIALWGKLDIPANKVSMILGLTASCLKQAFNIKDLPSDYVMHIPLTGSLNNIQLNKSVATSKIVALTLWQTKNVPSNAAGGLGGALVGGILNKVLAPPGNEGSTPPAKTPYPWQTATPSKKR